ncbi:glycosyltransferase [Flavobacterium orientale]|uniref:Glycosyl transferase group 1 n=1 Tax=Flavobacterium orientale TaxID=1756020 RepID=A0A916XVD0_9FLAO|nr:glycosyltransferase [Flavobacterium orientale]GGD14987.1 glycosyl transferase group 1 [Flavobacterium orientale]
MEKTKLKILYTIPNFDTAGSGKALLQLAKGLDASLFEVAILCLHDRGAYFETVKQSGIPIYIADFLPKERPLLSMFQACWKLAQYFKTFQPDVIHSFHYSSNYTEPLAAKMAGIPWVFTKKNMSWGGASKNSWRLRSFLATKIAVQNTDMQQAFYPSSSKTVLIPRGVSLTAFKPDVPKPEIRTKMTTDADKRIIICVANLVPVKGIEVLIAAFEKIAVAFPQWVVWIIGDDNNAYADQLKQTVVAKQLEHQILFSGKQLDVKLFLDYAELFVLPTLNEGRKEGSPVALLEAMANGKVVLGSNVPGIKDQLASFPEFLFKAGGEIDLKEKLEKLLLLDAVSLKKMGQQFQQHVASHYSLSLEIERHSALYRSISKK